MIVKKKNNCIHFRKRTNDNMIVELLTDFENGKWYWIAVGRMEGKWNFFTPEEDHFTPFYDNAQFSDEELKMIERELFKLIKEIKENHKYRLKLLNRIDDEYKLIWNKI